MTTRDAIVTYLDDLLDIHAFPGDKSANGLQVEGGNEVRRIVGAVDASLATYRRAIELDADLVFVHHGEVWGDGIRTFSGMIGERFRTLFRHDLSLYAAHLPLDAHPEIGHNACIARVLELRDIQPFGAYAGAEIGACGELPAELTVDRLAQRLDSLLDTRTTVIDPANRPVRTVGIVSGGGISAIHDCLARGIDVLVTGEINHTWYHPVHELGIPVLVAGHYKTEVPGVLAVLDLLRDGFDVECQFVDLPTGL